MPILSWWVLQGRRRLACSPTPTMSFRCREFYGTGVTDKPLWRMGRQIPDSWCSLILEAIGGTHLIPWSRHLTCMWTASLASGGVISSLLQSVESVPEAGPEQTDTLIFPKEGRNTDFCVQFLNSNILCRPRSYCHDWLQPTGWFFNLWTRFCRGC